MFTAKIYRRGQLTVYACDRYEVDVESPQSLSVFSRGGGWEVIALEPTDEVFIENLGGRTVHAIRRPRD